MTVAAAAPQQCNGECHLRLHRLPGRLLWRDQLCEGRGLHPREVSGLDSAGRYATQQGQHSDRALEENALLSYADLEVYPVISPHVKQR